MNLPKHFPKHLQASQEALDRAKELINEAMDLTNITLVLYLITLNLREDVMEAEAEDQGDATRALIKDREALCNKIIQIIDDTIRA